MEIVKEMLLTLSFMAWQSLLVAGKLGEALLVHLTLLTLSTLGSLYIRQLILNDPGLTQDQKIVTTYLLFKIRLDLAVGSALDAMGELLSEITKHDLTKIVAFIDIALSAYMDRHGTQQLFSRLSPSVKVPGVVENTVPNGQFSLKAIHLKIFTENLIDLISFAMGTFQMNFLFDWGLPTLERLYELKRRVLSPIRNFLDFFKGLSDPLLWFDWSVKTEKNPYSDAELGMSKHLFSSMLVIYHAVLTFVWRTTPKAVGL